MKISTSFLKIQNEKANVEKLDSLTDYMHYDIMDGQFVANTTLDFDVLKDIEIIKPKDVHLMVKDIYKYVDMYSYLNPEFITFHLEASSEPERIISYIKNKNIKVGISINPDTEVTLLDKYLKNIDLVLVMSVVPGQGGQAFIDITSKLEYLDAYRKKHNLDFVLEVDGGITDETIKKVTKADMAVVGSFITDNDNYELQFEKLRRSL